MIYKRNITHILPVALVFFSCSMEKDLEQGSMSGRKHIVTIEASVSDTPTKVSIDEYSAQWTQGDAFALYDAYVSSPEEIRFNSDFILQSGEGTAYGKFRGILTEGEAVPEERVFYALYPSSSVENGLYHISTAQEQSGVKDPDKLGLYALMWGEPVTLGADELPGGDDLFFSFHHLTSVLDLEISNVPSGEFVTKVSVSGTAEDGSYDAPFVSALKVAPGTTSGTISDNSAEYPALDSKYFTNSVSVTLSSTIAENFTASIMILPRDNAKFGKANHRSDTRDLIISVNTVDADGQNMKTYVLDKQDVPTGTWAEGRRYPVSVDMSVMKEKIDRPTVQDLTNSMDYEYRVENTTINSAVLKAKIVQGFHPSLEYGFMFGTDPENLEERPCTNMDATGNFELEVTGLESGVEYFAFPYARNELGEAPAVRTYSFRTAVYGGKQYEFDPDAPTDGASFERMKSNDFDLVYWELDPIETDNNIYWFLDRNLGARYAFTEENYSTLPVNNQESTWQSVGYYYQYNNPRPSATPDMNTGTNLVKTYGWKAVKDPEFTNDPEFRWVNRVCPDGYEIPSQDQFLEVINSFEDKSFRNLHSLLKIGATGMRNYGGGVFLTDTALSGLWSGNAPSNVNAYYFSVFDDTVQMNGNVLMNKSRYSGLPVRCVRVVSK